MIKVFQCSLKVLFDVIGYDDSLRTLRYVMINGMTSTQERLFVLEAGFSHLYGEGTFFNETACGSMYHGRIPHSLGLVLGYHSYLATARAMTLRGYPAAFTTHCRDHPECNDFQDCWVTTVMFVKGGDEHIRPVI